MADTPDDEPIPGRTIGDHGVIGNFDTAALVASDGTIDFLCWPHLDSPTVFAGLLDPRRGGDFAIAPACGEVRTLQLYLPETNVLLTRWLSEEASAELVDFMPYPDRGTPQPMVIRRVSVTRGAATFKVRCRPRFDYARATPEVRAIDGGVVFEGRPGPSLRLATGARLEIGEGEVTASFELRRGEQATFVLSDADSHAISEDDASFLLGRTVERWRRWASRSTYRGRWREQVTRSALALKLLTSQAHGSIAAAATFGLPEASGAGRNWDYRATWLRDASFTVYAFMRLGYIEEAERFRDWLGGRARDAHGGSHLQIMYALDGSKAATEVELGHLAGYGGARPVRIGNAAAGQRQLDVYGELMDSSYLANKYGAAITRDAWLRTCETIDFVCQHWQERDAGIWELRSEERHLLHSRLMCWVAIDRALRLAHKRSLPAPMVEWASERDRIAADIWANFRHPEHGYFVQVRGGTELDAALLMMPLVRFVSATDPVWLDTLDAIGKHLGDDGMIWRYRGDDGIAGGEGAFTACSFWYVECLARAGRLDDARLAMEKALRFANPLGLFSEELDRLGRQLGNFPQALTHLALISAAFFLDRILNNPNGGEWQP